MRAREFILKENDIEASPRSSEDLESSIRQREAKIKELEANIADLTPGFNPVTPDEGDDQSVAYTSPRQSREILKSPEKYKYGTATPKDRGFQRPFISQDKMHMLVPKLPHSDSDNTIPLGMELPNPGIRTSPLGIDRNRI